MNLDYILSLIKNPTNIGIIIIIGFHIVQYVIKYLKKDINIKTTIQTLSTNIKNIKDFLEKDIKHLKELLDKLEKRFEKEREELKADQKRYEDKVDSHLEKHRK